MKPEDIYRILEPQYFGPDMHEAAEIENLADILTDVDTFIDIGASLGQYTYFANQILQNARIVAVEADPIRYERLQELVGEWMRTSSNEILAVYAAITDRSGMATFYTSDSNLSGSVVNPADSSRFDKVPMRPIHVPSLTLDELVNRHAPEVARGMVKVDIEGGEHRLLLGGKEALSSGNFKLLIEIHSWGDPSIGVGPHDTKKLLRKYRYDYRRYFSHYLYWPVNRLGLLGGAVRRKGRRLAVLVTKPIRQLVGSARQTGK